MNWMVVPRRQAARVESALEFHLQRLEQAKVSGQETDFELGVTECAELFNEVCLTLCYVRLFQLRDWGRTLRHTARNLQVFDLVNQHAEREEDQEFLEKWRPYILRVNACAAGMQEVEKGAYNKALRIVKAAIEQIEGLAEPEDETFKFERERSLTALRELAEQIQKNRPMSEMEQLEHQLQRAIERQEFERRPRLRDQISGIAKATHLLSRNGFLGGQLFI